MLICREISASLPLGRVAVRIRRRQGGVGGVMEELASGQAVFAYDRPGYAGNPASEAPRDPCTVAAELRAQLRTAGLQPPYVLVGHSLGGLYQYVFARLAAVSQV